MLLSAIISLPLAAEEEIRLTMKVGNETGARTGFNGTIYASINEGVLTVSFSSQTTSRIVVYSTTDSYTTLYNNYFRSANTIQADLSSLSAGSYYVEIYAFGKWWIGYFVID